MSGSREAVGSWKMIDRRSPLMRCIALSGRAARSSFSSRIAPDASVAAGGSSRISASAVSDLPQPDSPTSASTSRRPTVNADTVDDRHVADRHGEVLDGEQVVAHQASLVAGASWPGS